MEQKFKGSIRFGAVSGGRGDGYVSIELDDEISGVTFLDLNMSYEDFGRAVGSNGSVDCEFTLRGIENIGKVREYIRATAFIGDDDYNTLLKGVPYEKQKMVLGEWLVKHHSIDGYHTDTYLGSRDDITRVYKPDGFRLRFGHSRYVTPPSA